MKNIQGAGLGLRREFINQIEPGVFPGWFEITPENWIHMPYAYEEAFEQLADCCALVAHGVSLSIGSPDLDRLFLRELKQFLDRYGIFHYSEHISYSSFYGAQSYELLPLPMTKNMADFIAQKIHIIQDILERPLIMENPTYYYAPYSEMPETDFINRILEKSGAGFLLDVNNVYVNSVNHGFDARGFIDRLNLENLSYIHIAGHTYYESDDLIIDTHGASLADEVWELLAYALNKSYVPVLLERDNNIPPLAQLMQEYEYLSELMASVKPYSQNAAQRRIQNV